MTELNTWSLITWIILILNVAAAFSALAVINKTGSLKRLTTLKAYLGYSCAAGIVVPMLSSLTSLTRVQYNSLLMGIDCLANLFICAVAWQLTRTVLPSLKWFIGVWTGTVSLILTAAYIANFPISNSLVSWRLTLLASLAAGTILIMCSLMPTNFWSLDYLLVAGSLVLTILGNGLMAYIQYRHYYSVEWLRNWFPVIRVTVPTISLVSYCLFLWAALLPPVTENEHLGGYR